MGEMKKITVEVPSETLDAAMIEGGSVTEVVREALRDFAHKRACARLLNMEGKLDLGLDLEELRKDKGEA
jgi:Arc/MetJ-type ribon-helix-helix transcriptional regulator